MDFIKNFASIELIILLFKFVNTVNYIDCFLNVKQILYSEVKTHLVLFVAWLSSWLVDGVIGLWVSHHPAGGLTAVFVEEQKQQPCDV